PFSAGCRLNKIDREGEEPVAAAGTERPAPGSGPPSGTESGEQILQIAQIHFAFGSIFATARTLGVGPIIRALRSLGAALVNLAAIVARPLFRVRDEVVGGGNRFESRFGFGFAGVQIRVKLFSEFAIGLANVVRAGIGLDPEYLIGRLRCHPAS